MCGRFMHHVNHPRRPTAGATGQHVAYANCTFLNSSGKCSTWEAFTPYRIQFVPGQAVNSKDC